MAINRSLIASQLRPGLNAIFGLEYKNVDNEHLPLFDTETSERAFEEEVLMTGFGEAPTKSEGAAVTFDNAQESYKSRYTMETVATACAITEEAIEDNLYDTWAKVRAKAMGRAMASTKQLKAANVFNNGFTNSAAFWGGDGVPLFSASHPTVAAGNQSNTVSADLSETALENAYIAIANTRDDRDILLATMPISLHIPRQLIFVAERILKSPGRVATGDNDINALRSVGIFPKGVFVNHRFTDTNAWFIRTDIPNGTKLFNRISLQTKMDEDFVTGNLLYKARERYVFSWSDWRQWFGSNGSS